MLFPRKVSKTKPAGSTKKVPFEKAFTEQLGRDPVTYISEKLAGGSDVGAIHSLFDIIAAEIELRNHCKCPGFDHYYKKAQEKGSQKPIETPDTQPRITKNFIVSQLIGKERFLNQYDHLLKSLARNEEFVRFVTTLRKELSGREIRNPKNENRHISEYFYANKADEQFSAVKTIVDAVRSYGRQSSAYISIYYAMYLYE